jgi:hypothetical protein
MDDRKESLNMAHRPTATCHNHENNTECTTKLGMYETLEAKDETTFCAEGSKISLQPDQELSSNKSPIILTNQSSACSSLEVGSSSSNASCDINTSNTASATMMLLFTLMGIGSLFAYNTLVTAVDWFQYIYPSHKEQIAAQIATYMLCSLLVTTVLLLPLTLSPSTATEGKHAHATTIKDASGWYTTVTEQNDSENGLQVASESIVATNANASVTCLSSLYQSLKGVLCRPTNRVAIGFLSEAVIMGVFALVSHPPLWLIQLLSVLIGAGDAMSSSGLYVYAASFHVQCTASVAFGSAIAGWFTSVLRWATLWCYAATAASSSTASSSSASLSFTTQWHSTRLFFALSSFILLGCFVSLRITMRYTVNSSSTGSSKTTMTSNHNHVNKMNRSGPSELELCEEHHPTTTGTVKRRDSKDMEDMFHVCTAESHLLRKKPSSDVSSTSYCSNTSSSSSPSFKNAATHSVDVNEPKQKHMRRIKQQTRFAFALSQCYLPEEAMLYLDTLGIVWQPALMGFLNFFITLSLFPGVITLIHSSSSSETAGTYYSTPNSNSNMDGYYNSSNGTAETYFDISSTSSSSSSSSNDKFPLLLIFLFNVWDCIGRGILTFPCISNCVAPLPPSGPSRQQWSIHQSFAVLVTVPTLLRLVFFPLMIACVDTITITSNTNASASDGDTTNDATRARTLVTADANTAFDHPSYVSLDLMRCALISLFGLTNGYVFGACFMVGPTMVVAAHAESCPEAAVGGETNNNTNETIEQEQEQQDFSERSNADKEATAVTTHTTAQQIRMERQKDAASLVLLLTSYVGLALGGMYGMRIVERMFPSAGAVGAR